MNCRLCLTEYSNEDLFLLFDSSKRNNTWTQIIFKYLNIKIDHSDDYSTAICGDCFRHISDFHSFCQFIETRQLELEDIRLVRSTNNFENNFVIKTETFEEETFTEVACVANVQVDLVERTYSTLNSEISNETEKTADVFVQNEAVRYEPMQYQTTLESFSSDSNLNTNDTDEDRTCIICNKMHKSFKALQSHMYKIHNDIKPYTCNRCGLQFRFRPNYKSHLQDVTCTEKGEVPREDIDRRTCVICRKVHKSSQGLRSHIYRYHSSERQFVCNKCGFGFRYEYSLRRHLSKAKCGKPSMHLASKVFNKDEDRTCGICQRQFKNVDALSSHMYITHKGAKPFACKTCGLEFRLRGTFLRHFWKCSGIPFDENAQNTILIDDTEHSDDVEHRSCVLCTRVFDDISTLYQHMTIKHNNFKPFSCEACGEDFVLKQALEAHSESHCAK